MLHHTNLFIYFALVFQITQAANLIQSIVSTSRSNSVILNVPYMVVSASAIHLKNQGVFNPAFSISEMVVDNLSPTQMWDAISSFASFQY